MTELDELKLKIRLHLTKPGYGLTPLEIGQVQSRINELTRGEKVLCAFCAKDITNEFPEPLHYNIYGEKTRYACDRYIGRVEAYPDVWNDQAWLCAVDICRECFEKEGSFDVVPTGKPK